MSTLAGRPEARVTRGADSSLRMRILPRTKYDFSNLQTTTSMSVVLAQHIDASVFQEVDLIVRLHGGTNIANAASTIVVGVVPDGYDFSDPAPVTGAGAYGDFLTPAPVRVGVGAVAASSTTTIPSYQVASLNVGGGAVPAPFGRLIAVTLYAAQGAASSALVAVLSVDVVLKSGDPTALPLMPNGYRGYRLL
jgi:hypothetical protein